MSITIAKYRYDQKVKASPKDLFLLKILKATDVDAIRING